MRVWLIYIRKSVFRDKSDEESPERQLHICQTLLQIRDKDYITEVYQDLGKSGTSEAGRDEWLRLKSQLSRPEVAGVAAYSLDRIYRNVAEFLAFLTELEKANKSILTARENLDTSSALGRFVVTILMALYEMEARLTSVRMVDMINHKRRVEGRHWGGAPFGTDRNENGQLVPSELTYGDGHRFYDGLLRCFEIYAGGTSYDNTAAALNSEGWRFWDRRRSPILWDGESVRSVVNRWRLYRGDLPLGNPVKDPTVEWVPGGHQAIIPIELANSAGAVVSERSAARQWSRNGIVRRIYILQGALYCHTCGQAMAGNFDMDQRLYRHARGKAGCPESWFAAEPLEQNVIEALIELAHQPGLFEFIRSDIKAQQSGSFDAAVMAEIGMLKEQLMRLEDLYVTEGAISKAAYLTRRQQIGGRLAELELGQQTGNGALDIAGQILQSFGVISLGDPTTKKALINHVFKRLEASGGQIKKMVPQDWAEPFFKSCAIWAGWESGTNYTIELPGVPRIIEWYADMPNQDQSI